MEIKKQRQKSLVYLLISGLGIAVVVVENKGIAAVTEARGELDYYTHDGSCSRYKIAVRVMVLIVIVRLKIVVVVRRRKAKWP